jgi:hypothetical protein
MVSKAYGESFSKIINVMNKSKMPKENLFIS